MKMEPIFEWPELSQRQARAYLAIYSENLVEHERGEADPPLTSERLAFYRQACAELNYLVNGKVAIAEENCDCPVCVDEEDQDCDRNDHAF